MDHEAKRKVFELADLLEWFEDNGHRVWFDESIKVTVNGDRYLYTEDAEYTVLPGRVLGELER